SLCHFLFWLIFKRPDISFYQSIFRFPLEHGLLWFNRSPHLYYRGRYIKYIFINIALFYTAFVVIIGLLIASGDRVSDSISSFLARSF
ncbi:MAG: hypothetical protein ABH858_00700, partial [Candidatus Omnitrophota bacterium]